MENRNRKVRKNKKKRSLKFLCISAAAFFLAILFSARAAATANAGTPESSRYKYYTSIKVEKDTSLWTIAGDYMTEEYGSEQAYIKEVMKINHLKSDVIYEGAYLCIPYFSEEKKQ